LNFNTGPNMKIMISSLVLTRILKSIYP